MSYLPTSPTYKPSHTPLPHSQPIQIALLLMSRIYTLYTLVIATPAILIAVEGLPSYQTDITCQLLVQLLHHIALAQIQHFRACPDNLPNVFGLPLHTTLSLLPGPVLELLHTHSFYHYLEELPIDILYPAFCQIYLTLTWAEQQHYRGQTGIVPQTTDSPSPIPLALQISSCPTSPAPSTIDDQDVIRIQITEGQWITSSASRVLVQCSQSSSPNTHCYICSDLGHHGLFCPMHTCPTCGEAVPGHTAHHCLVTQCDLCGRCDTPGHVVDNCPVDPFTQLDACSTYGGTYSDNDDLNTLVDNN